MLVVLYRWRRPAETTPLPAERFLGAMAAEVRYVRHAPHVRAVMLRGSVFVFCGSALWSLLPTVAKSELAGGPSAFGAAMGDLRRLRLRDGASEWGIYADAADPELFVEIFMVKSWLEHLRQHDRVTVEDREVERRVQSFHLGPADPVVHHLIGVPAEGGGLRPRAETGLRSPG